MSVQILTALTWEHLPFSAIWWLLTAVWGHINPCVHSEVSTYLWSMHTKWWKACYITKLIACVSVCTTFYKLVCVKLLFMHDLKGDSWPLLKLKLLSNFLSGVSFLLKTAKAKCCNILIKCLLDLWILKTFNNKVRGGLYKH